jgi:hypothetical protein
VRADSGRCSSTLSLLACVRNGEAQRAVLILRDVLKWRANEVAELLDTSEDAVNSTLRRARSALAGANLDDVPTEPGDVDRELLRRYVDAFKRYDVEALVAVLRKDAILAMPPLPLRKLAPSDRCVPSEISSTLAASAELHDEHSRQLRSRLNDTGLQTTERGMD